MVARLLDCEGEEVAEAEGLGDAEDCAERRWESSSSARMLRCAKGSSTPLQCRGSASGSS